MTNPQTEMIKFSNNICLFMCYLFCVDIRPDSIAAWCRYLAEGIGYKVLDDEGFVLDAPKLLKLLTGKEHTVFKVDLKGIEGIKNKTPVLYSMNGKTGHWVVVENGQIVFDPLIDSQNVKKGKPISARVITRG
ncbi:MAG: hypothetical protein KBT21_08670 [Treponema sp.]|nr:hypothetical protein [Candidatus Treponema merdequi]